TWRKYDNNPVLPNLAKQNRDPKVIWYSQQNKWVMALYLDRMGYPPPPGLTQEELFELQLKKNTYGLFSSRDLKHWEKMSEFNIPGDAECPELFEIAVDGDQAKTRWIAYGGLGLYLIGHFDGYSFKAESGPQQIKQGKPYNAWYASHTFNNIPSSDNRR